MMRQGAGQLPLRRKSGVLGWLLVVLLLVVGGGALWLWPGSPLRSRARLETAGHVDGSAPHDEMSIWFASIQEDALVSEKRVVPSNAMTSDRAKAILRELITGPKTAALRTVPADVKVRELFIDDQGTAYVDFTEALSRNHPGGPLSEMLTIQSIIQTLTANMPEIKRVQILIEGREEGTLAGHVDIRGPMATTWVTNQR